MTTTAAGVSILGSRVALRELTTNDTDAVHRLFGDDQVTSWLSFNSRSKGECRTMLRDIETRAGQSPRTEYYLGVTADNALVGFARLGLTGVHAAKLGYAIRRDSWNHGYATEAVRAIIEYGFAQLALHRISAAVGPLNTASIAVLNKVGMRKEGVIRDHVFTNNEWRDSELYSILRHEWLAPER